MCSPYLAQASVERKISDVGDGGTPGYRREWQGILPAKKAGYPLNREGFWLGDQFRIRAVQHYAPDLRLDGPGHKSEEFPIRFEERNSHEV